MNIFLLVSLIIYVVALLYFRKQSLSLIPRAIVATGAGALIFLSAFYLIANSFTDNGIDESVVYHLAYGLDGAGFGE